MLVCLPLLGLLHPVICTHLLELSVSLGNSAIRAVTHTYLQMVWLLPKMRLRSSSKLPNPACLTSLSSSALCSPALPLWRSRLVLERSSIGFLA